MAQRTYISIIITSCIDDDIFKDFLSFLHNSFSGYPLCEIIKIHKNRSAIDNKIEESRLQFMDFDTLTIKGKNITHNINHALFKARGETIILINRAGDHNNSHLLEVINQLYQNNIDGLFFCKIDENKNINEIHPSFSRLFYLILKKEILQTTGVLDEGFKEYFILEEWMWRTKRLGYNITESVMSYQNESETTGKKEASFTLSWIHDNLRWMRKISGLTGLMSISLSLSFKALISLNPGMLLRVIKYSYNCIPWPDTIVTGLKKEGHDFKDYLTDQEFWQNHWSRFSIPAEPDLTYPSYRSYHKLFTRYIPGNNTYRAIEIGCCPGIWLVYFAKNFGYKANGIEWLQAGVQLTQRNLSLYNLNGNIIMEDFFLMKIPEEKYDCVISMGFIEHFQDMDLTFDRHVAFVKPKGYLILAIPNFRGLNYYLQKFFNPDFLKSHNLEIMKKDYISSMLEKRGMKRIFIGSVCGFDPLMINFHGPKHRFFQILYMGISRIILMLRKWFPWTDSLNSDWFSCAVLAIYTKPDDISNNEKSSHRMEIFTDV